MSTPILPFAAWESGTNQASIPANDNSLRNQILNGLVISSSTTAQPGSPTAGDIYILAATHTGAQWAGFSPNDLVIFSGGTWYAFAPVDGVVVNCDGTQKQYTTGGGWEFIAGGGGGGSDAVLPWFNVKDDFGAVGDGSTDDTVAIQDAIDAVEAAGGGVVFFPLGRYRVNGARQDTSRSNSQLVLPIIDTDNEQLTIELRGEVEPPTSFSVAGATPAPDGHSLLEGTLNTGGGTNPSLLGGWGPSGSAGDFTNINLVVRNLTIRMPDNPVLSALNLSHVAGVEIDNVVVDCGEYEVQALTEPTTSSSYGVIMPMNNNGAMCKLGTVNVIGFYFGYQFAEHTNGENVNAWGCKRAFEFIASNHASVFQRVMAVHCEQVLLGSGGSSYLSIAQLDVEHATTGWWVTDFDVNDASNRLNGDIKWHVVLAGTGVDATFTVSGGTNLRRTHLGAAPGTGDVVGPGSAVDNRIAVFDSTTGKLIKDGGKTIADLRSPAIQTVSSAATVTPTFDDDIVMITAQAAGLTLANPTGTAISGLGQVIRIKDNGTARSISYGSQYRAIGVTLPTTTVISKTLYLGAIYNAADTKWDVVAVGQEA